MSDSRGVRRKPPRMMRNLPVDRPGIRRVARPDSVAVQRDSLPCAARTRGGLPTMPENLPYDDAGRPVTGILEILDSAAFLRTDGYLPGPSDVYVPQSLIRRHHLRPGDELTGVAGTPTGRQKLDPLLRVDSVHGQAPADAADRPEFTKLVSLHPTERLRLETEPHVLTTRVIDLLMPVGKGQRALIVSPPKAGKTVVLQEIARAITANNPECHIMLVLVGERP